VTDRIISIRSERPLRDEDDTDPEAIVGTRHDLSSSIPSDPEALGVLTQDTVFAIRRIEHGDTEWQQGITTTLERFMVRLDTIENSLHHVVSQQESHGRMLLMIVAEQERQKRHAVLWPRLSVLAALVTGTALGTFFTAITAWLAFHH